MTAPTIEPDIAEHTAGICVANLDTGLRLLGANDAFLDKLGRPGADVYGRPFGGVVHTSVKPVVLRHLDLLADGQQLCFNTRFVGATTAPGRLSGGMTGLAVRRDDGAVATIVVLVRPDPESEAAPALSRKRKALSQLDARVLEGVAAGSSTIQLAAKLYLSRQGIDYHVGAMLRRFKCSNRSALVAKAYSQGILAQGVWPPKVTVESIR